MRRSSDRSENIAVISYCICSNNVLRNGPISVRFDPQALEWLRSKGEGHLTRINDILVNPDGGRKAFDCSGDSIVRIDREAIPKD